MIFRLVVVFAVWACLGGAATAQSSPPPNEQTQPAQAERSRDSEAPPPPAPEAENSVDGDSEADRCPHERSDPQSVICAQWEQADWAERQFWIQFAAVLGALVTLFFTYRSLRAYVFFGYQHPTPWDGKVALEVFLKNQGGTPAEILEWGLYDDPQREFQEEPHYPAEGRKLCALILGTTTPWVVNERRLIPVEDRVLYGFVRYRDIFGVEHTSRFCDALSGATLFGDKPRIDARRHGGAKWSSWS